MSGAAAGARRAAADAARAARITVSAPWLLIPAAVPVLAAKLLPASSAGPGPAAAATRTWPVVVAAGALAAYALLLRAGLGRRPKSALDVATMTWCYALVALLLSSACGGFADERFGYLLLAHVRSDFSFWARVSGLVSFALQLAGMAWLVLVAFGLPTVPKHPELFGALLNGVRGVARRPAAAAAWVAAAAALDWLLARGGGRLALAASGGRLGEPVLALVAWARQASAYVLLVGAPLVAEAS